MYVPIHVHDHYSMLDGSSKTEDVPVRAKEIGASSCAITNHGSISGCVDFLKECKKNEIKPLLGCEIYVSEQDASIKNSENRSLSHLLVYAKNDKGWKTLLKLISESNRPEHFYYKPRLGLEQLKQFGDGNLLCVNGHIGSVLGDVALNNSYDDCKTAVKWFQDCFGKENFFLESQCICNGFMEENRKLVSIIRQLSKDTDAKAVGTPDAHYCRREDAILQRIILCKSLNIKLNEGRNCGMSTFFKHDDFFIPTYQEMLEYGNTEEELANTLYFADLFEDYTDILHDPILPEFSCPDNHTPVTWLRQLCREGWKEKIANKIPKSEQQEYVDRIKYELDVFEKAGLSSYFLIVKDILDFVVKKGWMVGCGRGCLSNTNIYLKNGITKDISDIEKGDFVYCRDGFEHQVVNTFKYPVEEELLHIETFFGCDKGITLTKDHKVLAIKRKSRYRKDRECCEYIKTKEWTPKWYEAREIKVGDYLVQPIIYNKGNNILNNSYIDLSKYLFCKKNGTKAKLVQNDKIEYYKTGNQHRKSSNILLDRYISINKKLMYLLGIFTGDGWTNTHNNMVSFCFHSDNNIKQQNFVQRFMEEIGCVTHVLKNQNGKRVNQLHCTNEVIQKMFIELFNRYKKTPQTKHIPDIIFSVNRYLQLAYLMGVIHSDGTIENKKRIKITSVSEELIYQLKFLCLQLGIPASIRKDNRKDFKNIKPSYYLSIPDFIHNKKSVLSKIRNDNIFVPVRKISSTDSVKHVYDIKVEGEHNYLTTSGIVHNSVGGCLVAYLLNITQANPIKYGLMLARFWNPARGNMLPDIDFDVPQFARSHVLQYIKDKYGKDNVGQIITFGTLQGRSALKEVLRAKNIPFEISNKITKLLPEPAKISGELQEMKEETGESSIILYALENQVSKFKEWCYIKDDESLELGGPYAEEFNLAIKLEGTKVTSGKHAAGIVIFPSELSTVCPLVYDSKTKTRICGLSLDFIESVGGMKLDSLGLKTLDKMMGLKSIVETGTLIKEKEYGE